MTINSVQKSSKSELSSGGKHPSKVSSKSVIREFSSAIYYEAPLNLTTAGLCCILGCNHPKDPCHWDEIIPMDGGWLPHWDEALDESTGIIEAVYFAI